jgi:dTDP-N-acetylfucosamine:lipid II N-acetylfucosaminyltransferase
MSRIVHLCVPEKFIPPFIAFVEETFDPSEHSFLIGGRRSRHAKFPTPKNRTIRFDGWFHKIRNFWRLYHAEKILIHGLFDTPLIYLLGLQPWLLKKCFWLIWGGDLYQHQQPRQGIKSRLKEFSRKRVIAELGHMVTYIPGDYHYAVEWYSSTALHHDCLCYLSNTFTPSKRGQASSEKLTIQVGNSAYPRNHHCQAIDLISKFKNHLITIIAPLSYGPKEEAARVAAYGKLHLGDKFLPILDFLPLEEYLDLLDSVDIGVFNQDHQQAMGNMLQLLGMGKTVYLRKDTSSWLLFQSLGLHVFEIQSFDLTLLTPQQSNHNVEIISQNFSKQRLAQQYKAIFDF